MAFESEQQQLLNAQLQLQQNQFNIQTAKGNVASQLQQIGQFEKEVKSREMRKRDVNYQLQQGYQPRIEQVRKQELMQKNIALQQVGQAREELKIYQQDILAPAELQVESQRVSLANASREIGEWQTAYSIWEKGSYTGGASSGVENKLNQIFTAYKNATYNPDKPPEPLSISQPQDLLFTIYPKEVLFPPAPKPTITAEQFKANLNALSPLNIETTNLKSFTPSNIITQPTQQGLGTTFFGKQPSEYISYLGKPFVFAGEKVSYAFEQTPIGKKTLKLFPILKQSAPITRQETESMIGTGLLFGGVSGLTKTTTETYLSLPRTINLKVIGVSQTEAEGKTITNLFYQNPTNKQIGIAKGESIAIKGGEISQLYKTEFAGSLGKMRLTSTPQGLELKYIVQNQFKGKQLSGIKQFEDFYRTAQTPEGLIISERLGRGFYEAGAGEVKLSGLFKYGKAEQFLSSSKGVLAPKLTFGLGQTKMIKTGDLTRSVFIIARRTPKEEEMFFTSFGRGGLGSTQRTINEQALQSTISGTRAGITKSLTKQFSRITRTKNLLGYGIPSYVGGLGSVSKTTSRTFSTSTNIPTTETNYIYKPFAIERQPQRLNLGLTVSQGLINRQRLELSQISKQELLFKESQSFIPKQESRLKLRTAQRTRQELKTQPIQLQDISFGFPKPSQFSYRNFIPLSINFQTRVGKGKKKIKRLKQEKGYIPSFTAIALNIMGKKPKRIPRVGYNPLTIRPLIK